MSGKYLSMLSELEDPKESFNAVARRHNASSATLYAMAKKHRPELIAKRRESGVHKQIFKIVEVSDEQREAAVKAILGGRSVKDVATDTGVLAPTLYKWVSKAKSHLNPPGLAILSAQVQDSAILKLLAAQIEAAAGQLNVTPTKLLAALAVQVQRKPDHSKA